jgi:prolyl-tRNA synthetase
VAEIEDHFGCKPGYLGPIGLLKPVKVVADRTVAAMATSSAAPTSRTSTSPA